jgi:hypothetical protein
MNENVLESQETVNAPGTTYTLAGWLAIAMGVLFPLGFLLGFFQQLIGIKRAGYFVPSFGLADIIFLAHTVIAVYVYLTLRKLLTERYDFRRINTLIILSILLLILFQLESLGIKVFMIVMWPVEEMTVAITQGALMVVNLLIIGVIDLLIGIKLLGAKDKLGDLFTAFAIVTLIAAICELTLFLAPIALILVPVSCVILGMIFLREKEDTEFI